MATKVNFDNLDSYNDGKHMIFRALSVKDVESTVKEMNEAFHEDKTLAKGTNVVDLIKITNTPTGTKDWLVVLDGKGIAGINPIKRLNWEGFMWLDDYIDNFVNDEEM